MPGKNKTHTVRSGKDYYISAAGKHTNQGTKDSPWSLAYAIKRVQPGDTLWLCGGSYPGKRGINITVSGTAEHKITIKPCPGDDVRLDGAIPEFTSNGNTAWEPYEIRGADHNVYRSVHAFPISEAYGGFIEMEGELYSLAPHKIYTYLLSDMHEWKFGEARYLGPGIAQDTNPHSPDYKHLFIRLDNSASKAQLDRPMPQIGDPDPRHHAIHIGSKTSVGMKISGSHLVIEDFTQINHFGSCIVMNTPGQTDVTIRNCGGRPIYFGMRCGYTDHLVVDACKFHAHMPSERWWVSYADIKLGKDSDGNTSPGEPVADQVRKAGLDLGLARNVKVANCVFEEFFDGILASAKYDNEDRLIDVGHDLEVHHTIFKNIWDDAWQMIAPLYQINFHHNFCLGAGPSVDASGSKNANLHPGTVYIHHNVIDTTQRLVFWGREGFSGKGMYEAIPLSSHGVPENYTWPRKLYYNTIVTGANAAPYHDYVGWSLLGAKKDLSSQKPHEVYNNIFVVKDGRPGGRDFDATSGWEIYDGNVYWDYRQDRTEPTLKIKTPWQLLWISTQKDTILVKTVDELHASQAFRDSQVYYSPGWEASGLSEDPELDRGDYRPGNPNCLTGAVDLSANQHWPGTSPHEWWRGAVPPANAQETQSNSAPFFMTASKA